MVPTPQTITLDRVDYERMLGEALKQAPNEACGLVAGTDNGGVRSIKKVYILENIDHSLEHFSLDAREQLVAIKDMRQHGLSPLGNWHSHPATPSRPSEEDMRLAFDKNASYFILSLAGEAPVLNAFHIESGESRKENLVIME